jgi:hypothetical protein
MLSKVHRYSCRICGFYDPNYSFYGEDGEPPLFDICPCCYVQIGHGDTTLESARQIRAQWIADGAKWHNPEEKPAIWDLAEQLKNIRPDFV